MTESTSAPVASSVQHSSSANASPKKKKVTAAKSKSAQGAAHPKYADMIKAALKALNDRGGSSRAAILKYVLANYSLDPVQANQHLKLALKNGVKAKTLQANERQWRQWFHSNWLPKTDSTAIKKKSTKPKKAAASGSSTAASATKKRARSKSAGSKPAKKVATAASVNTSATAAAPAAAAASAAKPKKVKIAKASKPRSSATPKSASAAKGTKKPKQGTKIAEENLGEHRSRSPF